jgi:exodeoxyribonuclease VII small subunit
MAEIKDIEQSNFEDKIIKAKELLEKLSNPQITLSDSINVYKTGVKELEDAQKLLDEAKLIFSTQTKVLIIIF